MSNWTQIDIYTTTAGVEPVGALLTAMDLGSYAIQDAEDFKAFLENKEVYWDYIDDNLMHLTTAPTILTVYVSGLEQGVLQRETLAQKLEELRQQDTEKTLGSLTMQEKTVKEEDWATAWKEYYHPVAIGKRLVICPTWEEYSPKTGQVVVRMDPGMAFGTGTHESTRLCLEELDAIARGGERVLDIGTGSGILAISALLLGAKTAQGVDIDQVAIKVAQQNAVENAVTGQAEFKQGSFTQFATGQYEIIFANIVADAIIILAPEIPQFLAPGGSFITSGIIDTRGEEVETALEQAGLSIVSTREEGGWVAFRAIKKEEAP